MSLPLWFGDLLFWSVQVAVLALAAALLVKILRIREPRALLVCWRTLVGASLLLPLVEPWQRLPPVPVATAVAPDISISTVMPAASTAVSHWHLPTLAMIAEVLGAVIAAGIAVRFVMLALGLLKLRQLRRKSAAIAAGAPCAAMLEETRALADGRAEFRLSGEVESPVTFGFSKPVILLPEKFLQLDARFQAAIACHELLHVRRRDWAHHLGEKVLRAVFWFHPAILWLVARVRLAREQVVDMEVVRLTAARKTYVEALLEFTGGRRVAAIPAPPFLAEQQFVERVAVMLKEAGMSRRRLIASLSVIGCGLAGTAVLAVSIFPLKAAPRPAALTTSAIQTAQGRPSSRGIQPVVSASSIQVDTVRKGDMAFIVRCTGTLVPIDGKLVARALVGNMENQVREVQAGQSALVDTHKGIVQGHVSELDERDQYGNRWVDIALDSALPVGVGANRSVIGLMTVGKLENVAYIPNPAGGWVNADIAMPLFKIVDNGKAAVRVEVGFGRKGINSVQVVSGLNVGDRVILSDMFPYNKFMRIEIKGVS